MNSSVLLAPEHIASPWKRLAASICDCLLLLFAHIVFWIFFNAFVDFSPTLLDSVQHRIQRGSVVSCWLYFWFSWSLGATPGQRLWMIRVTDENGRRPGIARGFVRCLGYMAAALPLKLGLIAAWFHPHRRGWHDRIARTLVVQHDAPRSFQLPPLPPLAPRIAPLLVDVSVARRGWPIVFVLYGILACAITWPVAGQLSTHLTGEGTGGDGGVFIWNYWFFRHALLSGIPLTSTDLLFYPERVSLLFHTMNWFNCALAFPLLPFFGSTATYNLLFLFSFTTCTFSAYWFCCAFTRNRTASFAAAIPFGFAAYFLAHGMGHPNLQSAQFLPVFALFYYAVLVQPRRRYIVAASIALVLNALCDWQYFLFCGIFGGCLFFGVHRFFATDAALFRVRSISTVLILTLSILLLAPLLIPAIIEGASNKGIDKSGQMGGFSAGAFQFFEWNPFHPLVRRGAPALLRRDIEKFVMLGWLAFALAAAGFWSARRRLSPFLFVAAIFTIGACGPRLLIPGSFPSILAIALGGAPANALDLPWNNTQLVELSQIAAADPASLGQSGLGLTLPFSWLPSVVPLLRPFRVVARLVVVVLLCVSLGVAFSLARLMRQAQWNQKTRWLIPLLPVLATAFFIFEQCAVPYPSVAVEYPGFYARLAREKNVRAVVEVPLMSSPETMARQTVSGKAIFYGNLARASPTAFRTIERNEILRRLCETPPVRNSGAFQPLQTLAQARAELQALGTRYVIVHIDKKGSDAYEDFLRNELHLPLIATEKQIRVYQL